MTSGPSISVVVVNYYSDDDVRRLMDCFQPYEQDIELVIISNSPLPRSIPGIQMGRNRGFAAAVNRGIRTSRGKIIIVMNPDVVACVDDVVDLASAVRRYISRGVGIVAPRLVNRDNSTQYSCRMAYQWFSPVALRLFPRSGYASRHYMHDYDHETPRLVDWVTGAVMAFSRELCDRIGPFDERFFLYAEDVDFCFRARSAGFGVLYFPAVTMQHGYHRGSLGWRPSTAKMKLIHLASFWKLMAKHGWSLEKKYSPSQLAAEFLAR